MSGYESDVDYDMVADDRADDLQDDGWDAMTPEELAAWDRWMWEGDASWDADAQELAMEAPRQEVRL